MTHIPPQLTRYNIVPKYVGDAKNWEYEPAEDGELLFAEGALEYIAGLERENTRLKALIETSTWVCGKCGYGSTEHGLVGHPAGNCIYEPVLITHNVASARQSKGEI